MANRKDRALHELARNDYQQQKSTPTPATPSLSYRSLTRRTALVGLVGSLGAALFANPAAADPQGVLEGTSAGDPLLKIRADRLVLVPRTSDVSSPADGTLTYRSDL